MPVPGTTGPPIVGSLGVAANTLPCRSATHRNDVSGLVSAIASGAPAEGSGRQGGIDTPPANEDYRLRPGDHYQESKLEGEQLALDYFRKGLPGSVVRPVGIYGPGDRRFLKLFKSIESGWFVMIGSGRTLYHMTYIDDLVQGFVLAGDSPTALNEVFTIGGPEYTTIEELVRKVAAALGVESPRWRVPFLPVYAAAWTCEMLCRPLGISPPLYRRRVEFFHLDRAFDISKARRLLGYEPQWSLSAGLAATAEAYRTAGWLPPPTRAAYTTRR